MMSPSIRLKNLKSRDGGAGMKETACCDIYFGGIAALLELCADGEGLTGISFAGPRTAFWRAARKKRSVVSGGAASA